MHIIGLEELLGPRADNNVSKRAMYRAIARDGFVSLANIRTTDRGSNTTLNTINTYLIASGIRSDLITDTMQTEFTINQALKKR